MIYLSPFILRGALSGPNQVNEFLANPAERL